MAELLEELWVEIRSLTTADTQRRCSSDCEVVGAIMM